VALSIDLGHGGGDARARICSVADRGEKATTPRLDEFPSRPPWLNGSLRGRTACSRWDRRAGADSTLKSAMGSRPSAHWRSARRSHSAGKDRAGIASGPSAEQGVVPMPTGTNQI